MRKIIEGIIIDRKEKEERQKKKNSNKKIHK